MKSLYKVRVALASIIFVLSIFGILGFLYPLHVFDVQFLPLLQRIFVDFSAVALFLIIAIVTLTLLFGRLYCSILCPLGILQEFIGFLFKKENKYIKNYPFKYFISAAVFGVLAGGSAVVLRYLEPYAYFCSAFTFCILGLMALVLIIAITAFKGRFFCTNICPAGTLLGLISKFSLNKINIEKQMCVSCGACEKNCPSSCINSKEKTIDNETCIKCLKCLEVCPKGGIKFGKSKKEQVKFNIERRKLIASAAAFALFGTMVKTGLVLKDKVVQKFKDIILPPGAQDEQRFANTCYNCNLCVENCPNKIIVKANKDFPVVHLDYTKGYCDKNCNKCSQVCPTGAIKRLSLTEKQKTRIAMAMIKEDLCTKCGICEKACPYGAIIKSDGKTIVNASKCIGCGACKAACRFNAIEIFAIKKQDLI